MTPEHWRKIREVVESVLELEPEEQKSLLREKCDGDPKLLSEIESLLVAHDSSTSLERPAVHPHDFILSPAPDRCEIAIGSLLGPYQIVEELGYGGMGTVFLARRANNRGKQVAIKITRNGLPHHAWQRLRTEYRVLAELDHPSIARVLHAGTTPNGRPYFVMEYIEGSHIDDYCVRHGLSATARVELINKVGSAVETAHNQGVIHRDLKPSNILVTADGEPKLLDFGIAKVLDPASRAFTVAVTRTHEQPMTPQYASPELLRGEKITPCTDVYALGVVLYKLLTGRLPYELRRYTPHALEHAFQSRALSRPSTVATDGAAPGLDRGLSEELDAVVMKALSIKTEERFKSMAEFTLKAACAVSPGCRHHSACCTR